MVTIFKLLTLSLLLTTCALASSGRVLPDASIELKTSLSTASSSSAAATSSSQEHAPWLVSFAITNPSNEDLMVLSRSLPLNNVVKSKSHFAVFELNDATGESSRVAYEGLIAKYSEHTTEDEMVVLAAGQTKSFTVDLSTAFVFRPQRTYRVVLTAVIKFVEKQHWSKLSQWNVQQLRSFDVRAAASMARIATSFASSTFSAARSPDTVTLRTLSSASTHPVEQSKARSTTLLGSSTPAQKSREQLMAFSTQGCSTTQQATFSPMVTSCTQRVSSILSTFFNADCSDSHFSEFFGPLSSITDAGRYVTAKTTYTNELALLNSQSFTLLCNSPDCSDNVFAFVYPTDTTHVIYLCSAYWGSATNVFSGSTATDTRPGTIIHEMSHFNDIGATDDVVYGISGCRNLANSNPANTVRNADTYEYFAETFTSSCATYSCPSTAVNCSDCRSNNICGWCASNNECVIGGSSRAASGTCFSSTTTWNTVCSASGADTGGSSSDAPLIGGLAGGLGGGAAVIMGLILLYQCCCNKKPRTTTSGDAQMAGPRDV